jgi:hypothetical protein
LYLDATVREGSVTFGLEMILFENDKEKELYFDATTRDRSCT